MTEGEFCEFEDENKPEPEMTVREVSRPETTFTVDWDEREKPTPRDFNRVGSLEVKLVTMVNSLPEELHEQLDAAQKEIVELRNQMLDARGIEDEQTRRQIHMGNLEALPEVSKDVEY